jgi:adenine-specific DNA-methyltransferase
MRDAGISLNGTFCDLFAGTGSVGGHFKRLGMTVIANDLMTYSYVMNKAVVELNGVPHFWQAKSWFGLPSDAPLSHLLDAISDTAGTRGYIFENFSPSGKAGRQFFTDENGMKIDAIRELIDNWSKEKLISSDEFIYLLASLINAADHVANMSGTYGAYLKIWRSVALKRLRLLPLDIFDNKLANLVFQEHGENLIHRISGDILYLDPPYNSRQYASNFHLLETLSVWDKQDLRGVVGLRDYSGQKSAFSSKKSASDALRKIVAEAKFKHIVLSYNNEGIIHRDEIVEILGSRGNLKEFSTDYRRFRTERNHEKRKYKDVGDRVTEHLWIVSIE